MSENDQLREGTRSRQAQAMNFVRAAARGLVVGVITVAAAAATVFALLTLDQPDRTPCASDLACLPDVGPLLAAAVAVPLAIALIGPLAALLLRLPRPGLFALPAAWAVVVACVASGPADRQTIWPFSSLAASLTILLIPYALIAAWAVQRRMRTDT